MLLFSRDLVDLHPLGHLHPHQLSPFQMQLKLGHCSSPTSVHSVFMNVLPQFALPAPRKPTQDRSNRPGGIATNPSYITGRVLQPTSSSDGTYNLVRSAFEQYFRLIEFDMG
jgi:hypothetical protein